MSFTTDRSQPDRTQATQADVTPTRAGRHPAWRWAAPLAAIALVAAGTFGASTLADADPGLPPRTPEQLVTDALTAKVPGMSGTVSTTVELGLPDLGSLGGGQQGGQPSVLDWLSGTHTARVWQSGEDKQRVSVPDGDSEYGVYRSGSTTWLWSSEEQKATKITAETSTAPTARPDAGATPPTPQEAAQQLLATVGQTSTITPASNATVAGRSAYKIVVTPTQTGSKVGRVELAIDGETKVPLRVEVFGVNAADPSISVGFTDVDFTAPADSVFAFTPPPGATVETKQVEPGRDPQSRGTNRPGTQKPAGNGNHEVVGTGWQTVMVMSGIKIADVADQPALQQVLNGLPHVKGAWGSGRVFSGPLFSAVLTDDGRVAVGAVVPDVLYAALS